MKIYNQEKTQELTEYDLEKGYLKPDKRFVAHHEAQAEVQEKFHYEVEKTYPNGGKDVKKVVDVPGQSAHEAYDEYEDIQVYMPYTADELLEMEKNKLRAWREKYFTIIDRACWYDCLTDTEKTEVKQFRQALLDITETMEKPAIPNCVATEVK